MALDAYSLCPGGTDKKIKFCCPDFLPELQKIDRMLDGDQHLACLQHLRHLREQPGNRDRQCLMAQEVFCCTPRIKPMQRKRLAAEFLAAHPANSTAMAECCIAHTAEGDSKTAMQFLQRAFRTCRGRISWRVYVAAKFLAQLFLVQNQWLAAQKLIQLLMIHRDQDPSLAEMAEEFYRSVEVPLMLKDGGVMPPAPADVPWAERYREAVEAGKFGDVETMEAKLTALAKEVPNSPVLWKALARAARPGRPPGLHRGPAQGCGHRFLARRHGGVEAQAMFLADDPLGDEIDVRHVTWIVNDADRLNEALLSERRMQTLPFNPADLATEDSPPPRAVFLLLDRSVPESAEGLTAESLPCVLGNLFLYGRQTDREARLDLIGLTTAELPSAKAFLAGLGGDWLGGAKRGKDRQHRFGDGRPAKAAVVPAAQNGREAAQGVYRNLSTARDFAALAEHETRLLGWKDAARGVGRRGVQGSRAGGDHGSGRPRPEHAQQFRFQRIACQVGPAGARADRSGEGAAQHAAGGAVGTADARKALGRGVALGVFHDVELSRSPGDPQVRRGERAAARVSTTSPTVWRLSLVLPKRRTIRTAPWSTSRRAGKRSKNRGIRTPLSTF